MRNREIITAAIALRLASALPQFQWRGGHDQVGYRDDFERIQTRKSPPIKPKTDKRAKVKAARKQRNLK